MNNTCSFTVLHLFLMQIRTVKFPDRPGTSPLVKFHLSSEINTFKIKTVTCSFTEFDVYKLKYGIQLKKRERKKKKQM